MVVAGLLTSRAESAVARILDGMLLASFRFAMSKALLAKRCSVMLRPKLLKLRCFNELEVATVLINLASPAIVLPMPRLQNGLAALDSGDQFLWNLLSSCDDLLLVTGDKLLLQAGPLQPRVMTSQLFVSTFLS